VNFTLALNSGAISYESGPLQADSATVLVKRGLFSALAATNWSLT